MEWHSWIGWVLGTITSVISIRQSLRDRYRLQVNVRYIPEANSYTIEVSNIGRRSVTITGAGIGGVPSIFEDPRVYVWSADEGFPKRIDEGDTKYFNVWWGDDVTNRDKAGQAWVRDARGKEYTARLPNPEDHESVDASLAVIKKGTENLTSEQIAAKLYNASLQRERLQAVQRQLAYIDAQVNYYKMLAEMKHEEQQKAVKKPQQATLEEKATLNKRK